MPAAGANSSGARSRDRTAGAGTAGETVAAEPTSAPTPIDYTALHLWFVASLGAVALWWAVLFWMAITTANPVTLNYQQIVHSPHVVTATVLDAEAGMLRVERDWRLATPRQVTVANLAETGATNGTSYLVPLTIGRGGDLRVTDIVIPRMDEGDEPRRVPRVYPATDEAITQLEGMLAELAAPRE